MDIRISLHVCPYGIHTTTLRGDAHAHLRDCPFRYNHIPRVYLHAEHLHFIKHHAARPISSPALLSSADIHGIEESSC
jgi:hypothetical protein